ncbi:MAG: hypothetical protein ACKVOW_02900 [Chitinophagaceae bacterium]
MKKNNLVFTLLFFAGIFIFGSCKKNVIENPGPGPSGVNHPNFICLDNSPANPSKFTIFDLDHDDNKDKKYFSVVVLPNANEYLDSSQVIETTKPIDNLALNWPAQIKSAAFCQSGSSRSILIDAKNYVSYSKGDPWEYGPITTNTNLYQKLNDPIYASSKAGQKPYGNNFFSTIYNSQKDNGVYLRQFRDITYYFKDGVYTDNAPNGGLKSLDGLFPGATAINWRSIDQVATVEFERINTFNRYYTKYFYFDWTNWKYYTVTETELSKDLSGKFYISWVVKSYSLNSFCKWPAGWGKK